RGGAFARIVGGTVDIGAFEVAHPWHNTVKALDVNGGPNSQPDGPVVPGDALAIINYINASGSGAVPPNAAAGQPFGFIDTSDDNNISPIDALGVINAINAGQGGEGEAGPTLTQSDLLALLAQDMVDQTRGSRRLSGS